MRNCFAVLWNSLQSNNARNSPLSPRNKLQCQLQALTFRLLEQESNAKVPLFVEEVVVEFERSSKSLTHNDVTFLTSELQQLFLVPSINPCLEPDSIQALPLLAVKCEILFKVCKLLCKSRFTEEASGLLRGAFDGIGGHDVLRSALRLGDRAVKLHSSIGSGGECGKAFTECARIIRALPSTMSGPVCHALLEACQLVIWAVEAGQSKGMSIATLLTSFSFLEEYQEHLLAQQKVKHVIFNSHPLVCVTFMHF